MKPDPRVVAFLQIATEELAAAKALVDTLPRQAAYFAQQSVEKVARAILAAEGIAFGTSHSIAQMAATLPEGHDWRTRIAALDWLSKAATTYRYPTPAGRLVDPPTPERLRAEILAIETLLLDAEREVAGGR